MDVELLRWPSERDKRERLRGRGAPRLLLIEGGSEPPTVTDLLEDWIRVPADRLDVRARITGLIRRADHPDRRLPEIDETGLLVYGTNRVTLPPTEARILGRLIEGFGTVVSREELVDSAWPSAPSDRNVLDVHLVRLRRRIAISGLQIRTVRSRGLLLERT